jgi:hypothetical protein
LPVPGEKLLDAGWMLAGWMLDAGWMLACAGLFWLDGWLALVAGWMLDAGWMLAGWLDGFSFWQL